jgi:alginate O-acetyltransferase complex protein AlgI
VLFNSLGFWVFLGAVWLLYITLSLRWQNRLLLVASYVFYAAWDYRFLSLIVLSTAVDFVAGRRIESSQDHAARRRWLYLSLAVNLGLLGAFKYCGFFVDSAQRLLTGLGWGGEHWSLNVIVPVGISFYTFQTLSYTIDIYRGRLKPVSSLVDFALFVAFFPQLVAGPIERAASLLPQLARARALTWEGLAKGAVLIVFGLFKKVAIADQMAPHVQAAFADPSATSSPGLLLGLYAFSLQIYADFSGYTDIARGVGKLLGIDLIENFRQPYFSASITEFWRRWHVSLSAWLRDYLYIPLGGNRGGRLRTYRNLMLTMLLGGLWHGAAWTFVVWGALHGAYLAVHKLMLSRRSKPGPGEEVATTRGWIVWGLQVGLVFHLVTLTWIFFRAEDLPTALSYLEGLLAWRAEGVSMGGSVLRKAAWLVASLLVVIEIPQHRSGDQTALLTWRSPWRIAGLLVLVLWTITAETQGDEFIYFQF